jgi:cell cycle related kinase
MFTNAGLLKLGDFGLARIVDEERKKGESERPMSLEIATRWYKSPEILLGSRHYGKGVDIWAIGCIFAELMDMTPLFAGSNDIE